MQRRWDFGLRLAVYLFTGILPGFLSAQVPVQAESCEGHPPHLHANLWMQTSAEYRALCQQTFNTALKEIRQTVNRPSAVTGVRWVQERSPSPWLLTSMKPSSTTPDSRRKWTLRPCAIAGIGVTPRTLEEVGGKKCSGSGAGSRGRSFHCRSRKNEGGHSLRLEPACRAEGGHR